MLGANIPFCSSVLDRLSSIQLSLHVLSEVILNIRREKKKFHQTSLIKITHIFLLRLEIILLIIIKNKVQYSRKCGDHEGQSYVCLKGNLNLGLIWIGIELKFQYSSSRRIVHVDLFRIQHPPQK